MYMAVEFPHGRRARNIVVMVKFVMEIFRNKNVSSKKSRNEAITPYAAATDGPNSDLNF